MKQKKLGVCQFCGHNIYEFPSGWGCSAKSGGCGATIFRTDKFFSDLLCTKPTKNYAVTLLTGRTLRLYNVHLSGAKETSDVTLELEKDPNGVYQHHYRLRYFDKRDNSPKNVVTGFDFLNGE